MKISIIGSGSWGCAIANVLYNQGNEIVMFSFIKEETEQLSRTRQNKNLPGLTLPKDIKYTDDISLAADAEVIILAVPSVYMRSTCVSLKPYITNQIIVDVAKGIEENTLYTMSEVIKSELPRCDVVVLSGPTHAEEVALNLPTCIISACENAEVAKKIATLFEGSCIRAYTNTDVLGVEICGALKNVIALFCGIAQGVGCGDNAKAAIITRGMLEMSRIGMAMGCFGQTFYGLAGMGDLIVTATSVHSRNNRCGQLIGKGYKVEDAVKEVGMVVEGLNALGPAVALTQKYNVRAPIIDALDEIVNNGADVVTVLKNVLYRPMRSELDRADLDAIYDNMIEKGFRK